MIGVNIIPMPLAIVLLVSTYSVPLIAGKKLANAPEHNILNINCPSGVINVLEENYGYYEITSASWKCVSQYRNVVRDECANKQECSILATNNIFGDPCPGIIKQLAVEYECVPAPPPSPNKRIITCEGSTMNIKCNPGSFIDVLRANYGRHSKTTCNPNGYAPVGNINCVSPNSFNIVDVRCSDQEKCSITADNGVFGDPCGGTLKYLDVEYQCISKGATIDSTVKQDGPTSEVVREGKVSKPTTTTTWVMVMHRK